MTIEEFVHIVFDETNHELHNYSKNNAGEDESNELF